MRGKIASATDLELVTFKIARPPSHFGPNCVNVRLTPDQLYSQPVILPARIIAQENGRPVILRDKYIDGAVVIEIA